MYGQHDNYYGTAASISVGHNHRFNPNAPAFRAGSGSTFGGAASGTFQQPSVFEGYGAAEYAPHPMNAAALMMADQPRVVAANLHSNDAHQTSFGSSNNSCSGPSTPAMAGMPSSSGASKRNRYTHNPYASSNASNSEPSSPAVAPAVPPRGGVAPMADAAFFNSMSSNGTSAPQSPVYAPNDANLGVYGDAASHHPIAFSINEQFAQARGSLAAAACTPRGRHLIVGALRQQHTDKIQAVFEEIAPNVAAVVMDGQGGHVVRTLIEFLNEMQVAQLVEYLTPEVVLTIATSSQNTRRVLQTLFERHRTPALQPVVDVIATHAIALSTTQQGCIAVMRCIEHTSECQKTQVLLALQPQLAALTMDPYGNYVAQAVLQYFPRETACEVIEKAFHGHWVNLSCNKFASNVMEKFIQAATPMTRKTILDELVFSTEALGALMQDGFGNFVLQQIIDTCTTGPEYRKLVDKVRPQLPSSPFGHKIEAKLKAKRFGPPYEGAARETTNAPSPQSGTSSSGAGARQAGKPRRDGENTTAGQRRGAGGSGGKPSSFSSKPLDAIDAKASVSSRSGSAVSTGSAPVTAE